MAFQSPNHTQIPNDLFDSYLPKMGYAELKVVLVLARETFGYHRTKNRMSIRSLAKKSGLSARNAYEGAQAAIRRGLVTAEQDGGVTQWGVVVRDTPVLSQGIQGVVVRDTPSNKESIKERKKDHGADKPRPRDLLFDAICEACAVDPATAGPSVGKVKAVLIKANPSYTADEVRAWRATWPAWKDKAPTIWQLKEQIGSVRNGNGTQPSRDKATGAKQDTSGITAAVSAIAARARARAELNLPVLPTAPDSD